MNKFLRHISLSAGRSQLCSARRALHCSKSFALASGLSSARKASFALLTPVSLALAVLCTACAWMHEDISLTSETDYDSDIRIYSQSRGLADMSPRLTLWLAPQYNRLIDPAPINEELNTYWDNPMNGEIDDYSFDRATNHLTPYNTYTKWPNQTDWVYASGIAPNTVIASNSTLDNIYLNYNVENAPAGTTDILASNNDGTSRGSFDFPFVKNAENEANDSYNEERELQFRHLTAAITFKGKRDKTMIGIMGVRKITVEINNNVNSVSVSENGSDVEKTVTKVGVPTSLRRYVGKNKARFARKPINNEPGYDKDAELDAWTYVVNEVDDSKDLSAYYEGALVMDLEEEAEAQEIATFYGVTPGINYKDTDPSNGFDPFNPKVNIGHNENDPKPVLSVNIEAEYFLIGDKDEVRVVRWTNIPIANWLVADGADPTGDKFMPAHKYEVTINFTSKSIGLRAELVPWVEKGPYYYPVLGTTDNPVKLEARYNNETAPVTKDINMESIDDKVYTLVTVLNTDYVYGFRQMDATSASDDNIQDIHLEFENRTGFGDPQDNGSYATDYIVHYPFTGTTGKNLIILDKISKTLVAILATNAEGYYFNEQKIDATYTDAYTVPNVVHLTKADASLHYKQVQEYHVMNYESAEANRVSTLSLKDYNLSESPFEYNNPTAGLRVDRTIPTPINGDFHIIVDMKSGNEAIIAVPVRGADNAVLNGYYLGNEKFPTENLISTSKYKTGDLIALTQVAENGAVNNIKFKTNSDTNTAHDDWFTVVDNPYLTVDENGTCRFKGVVTSHQFRFILNPDNKTLNCVLLDPSLVGTYMLNGNPFPAPYSIVKYLKTTESVPMVLTIVGEDFSTSNVLFNTGWTINSPLATTNGKDLKLVSGDEGWYSIQFDMANKTISAARVANEKGDAPYHRYYVNGTEISGTSYSYKIKNWTPETPNKLPVLSEGYGYHDESNTLIPTTNIAYTNSWTLSDNITLDANSNTISLKSGNETFNYIVTINISETKIIVEKVKPHVAGMIIDSDDNEWFTGDLGTVPNAWSYTYSDANEMDENHLVTWTNTSGLPDKGMYLKPYNANTVTLTTNDLTLPAGKIKFTIYAVGSYTSSANIGVTISKNGNVVLSKNDVNVDKWFSDDKCVNNVIQSNLPDPYAAVSITADNSIEGGSGYTLSIKNECGGWRPFLILGFKIETVD